jgi:hypothetical protein
MKLNNNTIYKQKSNFDQFYTTENTAKKCYSAIWDIYNKDDFDIFLEPSAGSGSFFNLFPVKKRIGLDIDPKTEEIKKQDFFKYEAPVDDGYIITIGNPPFGRICSLAIKFFNTAAKFSEVIAFIIPKTFQKQSLQNKLDQNFHLRYNIDIPRNSFVLNGEPYNVPCCFQIWEKSQHKREINKVILDNNLFSFEKKDAADMAIRRVGGRAGKAQINNINLSKSTHYFLNINNKKISTLSFIDIINEIDFSDIVNSTAGVRSLSKPELILKLRSCNKLKGII